MPYQAFRIRAAIVVFTVLIGALAACNVVKQASTPEAAQAPSSAATPRLTGTLAPPAAVAKPTSATAASASPGATAPLVSKTLEPSTADQTVSYQSQVKVTVPGGTLDGKQTLTISPAPDLPPPAVSGLVGLDGFDISMGDAHEFKKDLIIEIAYDPSKIVSDLPPEKALMAAYWDPAQKIWVRERAVVDPQRRVVIIRTNRLSFKKLWYVNLGWAAHETEHFLVLYDPKETGLIRRPALSPQRQGATIDVPVPSKQLAVDLGSYLEHAWEEYFKYFDIPRGDSAEGNRVWVWVDPKQEEAERGKFTASLYFPTVWTDTQYKESADQLRHEAAHELFHAVQNRYFSFPGMVLRRWWIEATADYAADAIGWGGAGTMPLVPATYFKMPITSTEGLHDYKTSRFIAYLARPAGSFIEMWDYVAKEGSDVPAALDGYLKTKRATSLQKEFRDFVAYVLFDSKGPLSPTLLDAQGGYTPVLGNGLLKSPAIEQADILEADNTELSHSFKRSDDYTASVWGIRVKPQAGQQQRRLKLEITGAPPLSGLVFDVYVLKNDFRPDGGAKPEGTLSGDSPKMDLRPVDKDDVVYIVEINTGAPDLGVTVKVSEVSTGTWVLVKREVGNFGPNTGTVSGNTAQVRFIAFQGEVSSWTCSWPEPPQTLEIGQKWGGTVTVSNAGSIPSENYWARGSVSMNMSGWKPGAAGSLLDAGGSAFVSGTVGGQLSTAQPSPTPTRAPSQTPAPTPTPSTTQNFSWTIPGNGLQFSADCQGGTVQPNGKGGDSGTVAGVAYYYELRK